MGGRESREDQAAQVIDEHYAGTSPRRRTAMSRISSSYATSISKSGLTHQAFPVTAAHHNGVEA